MAALADACKVAVCRTMGRGPSRGLRGRLPGLWCEAAADPMLEAEALLKRAARDGALPSVNAVVDLYNAVSLRFAIPVGGENAESYAGVPHLVRATGTEKFETMQCWCSAHRIAGAGEVIWRDEQGITCRRWNWRQGTRTRIEDHDYEYVVRS